MTSLVDFLEQPHGDPAGKAKCFLQGGRFNGDTGSIRAPAPELLAVVPCDGSCATAQLIETGDLTRCGMPTHWHDVTEAELRGDLPRHANYYVLVRAEPAPSGMVAALYWSAGHEYPTRAELARAHNDFARTVRARAAAAGVTVDINEGNT